MYCFIEFMSAILQLTAYLNYFMLSCILQRTPAQRDFPFRVLIVSIFAHGLLPQYLFISHAVYVMTTCEIAFFLLCWRQYIELNCYIGFRYTIEWRDFCGPRSWHICCGWTRDCPRWARSIFSSQGNVKSRAGDVVIWWNSKDRIFKGMLRL